MLVVSVDVLEVDVFPIKPLQDVHLFRKYVWMCRCAFDQMVSCARKLMRLRAFELRGPDSDV